MAYRLVIGCNMGQYDTVGGVFTPDRYLVLDNIKDKQITSSAKIATQPLQSGDTMSDHMYREPTQYNVTGTFSLNGKNWNDDSYNFMNVGDRLTNIEEVFESIKDNGILCTLITIDCDETNSNLKKLDANGDVINASTRFKVRRNMALQSITWTEMYNSVNFSFTFHQIIMVEQQEYENLEEAERVNFGLPNVCSPKGSTLGTVLQETGQLQQTVIQTLYDNGYIKSDFLQALATVGQVVATVTISVACIAAVIAVCAILAKVGAIIISAQLSAIIGTSVAVGASVGTIVPVGTIVVAAVAIVAIIAVGIAALVKKLKEKQKEKKAFKLINGSPEPDGIRLSDLLDKVENVINHTISNVTVYQISSDDEQQVILNIAGDYYIVEFTKDNTQNYGWKSKVTTLDGSPVKNMCHDNWCVVSSFMDMNRNQNCWFRDNTKQFEVYLMNPAFSPEYNPTGESVENVKRKLSSYTIFVSKGDIEANVKILQDALIEAIHMEGFV